jgi:hypothetical protein
MTTPTPPPGRPNPDRVAKPVALWAAAGLLISAVGQALLDGVIDPSETRTLTGEVGTFLLAAVPALTAYWGARRARGNVTPIRTDLGDQPRDREFRPLQATPSAGPVGWRPDRADRGRHERDDP